MKKVITIFLCLVLVLSCGSVAFAAEKAPGFGDYDHVFIIGVDGLGATFSQVESPSFDAIFGAFAYRYDAQTEKVTVSAQNWGSILTGVDYKTHGFTNSNLKIRERDSSSKNHSIFYYTRQAMPDAELVSFNNWDAINHGIIETDLGVKKINCDTDPKVAEAIESYLDEGNVPKLMFVQLDSVDHAAHTHGGLSDEYLTAPRRADTLVGSIYNAIASHGLMKNSLFILVADHGEAWHGHGGRTREESSAVLAVAGKTVNQVQLGIDAHNRDVSAIALHALGIKQPSQFISKVPAELFGKTKRTVPKTVTIGTGDFTTADLDDDPPFGRKITNAFELAFHTVASFLLTWMDQI